MVGRVRLFAVLCVLVSVNGNSKSRRKTSMKQVTSPLATYIEPSCDSLGNSSSTDLWLKDVENLKQQLQQEMEEKFKKITELMQKQASCFQVREKELLKNNECDRNAMIPPNDVTSKVPMCETSKCMRLSSRMLHTIDHKAQPCTDFYQYACGGVEKDVHLQPESSELEAKNKLRVILENQNRENPIMGHARVFYDACLTRFSNLVPSEEDKSYAREIAMRFGKFHANSSDKHITETTTTNLTYLLASFMKSDFTPFFDVTLEPNPEESSTFVLRISLSFDNHGLSEEVDHSKCIGEFKESTKKHRLDYLPLNLDAEYEKYVNCKREGEGLKDKLKRAEEAIDELGLMNFIHKTDIKNTLMQVTKMNTKMLISNYLKIRPREADVKLSMLTKHYKEFTLEQLPSQLGDTIDWNEFFYYLTGKQLSPSQIIHLYHKKATLQFLNFINKKWETNEENIYNSLMMLWAENVYSNLVSPLKSSQDYCLTSSIFLLPDISSALYIHSFPDSNLDRLHRNVQTKMDTIKTYMTNIIDGNLDYFGIEMKNKIDGLKINYGASYGNKEMANSSLINNVQGLLLNSSHAYNVNTLLLRKRNLLYSLLQETTNLPNALWMLGILPMDQVGFYSYELNKIYMPYGTFFPPYLYDRKEKLPDYITYGGLGHLVTSEMMHLFHPTGLKYNGTSKSKMSDEVNVIFARPSECFEKQVDVQRIELTDGKLKAYYNLTKDISKVNNFFADAWAAKMTWLAYDKSQQSKGPEKPLIWLGEEPLSPIKAYFLKIAQSQCRKSSELDLLEIMEGSHFMPQQKINFMMKNEPLFKEAFECKEQDAMSGELPCQFPFTPVKIPDWFNLD